MEQLPVHLLCDIGVVALGDILLGALLLLPLLQVLHLLLPCDTDGPIRLLHPITEVNCSVLQLLQRNKMKQDGPSSGVKLDLK